MTSLPKPYRLIDGVEDTRLAQAFADAVRGATDWPARADALDLQISESVRFLASRGADAATVSGCCYAALTRGLERLDEQEIASTDAALFYLVSVHAGWRSAARRYLAEHDTEALVRARPGVHLLWSIASARALAEMPTTAMN